MLELLEEGFNQTNIAVRRISDHVNTVIKQKLQNFSLHDILSLSQALSLAIYKAKLFQNKIIVYLMKDQTSFVDPELFPWSNLEEILVSIKKEKSTHRCFPWDLMNENNKMAGYKQISMRIYAYGENIVMEMHVPLIAVDSKELFELFSIPILTKNKMYYVHPKSKFAIINRNQTEITYLDEQDYNKCWKISDKKMYVRIIHQRTFV